MAQAPDQAAVLQKLELLIKMLDGQEDQGRVAQIRNDMRRLLGATTD